VQYKRERKKNGGQGSNQYAKVQLVQNGQVAHETGRGTSERLGEQRKVSRSTIKRDSQLVDALDILADNLGEEVSQYY
jgi:hypothetical protein